MSLKIPERLLNLKILSVMDLILGLLCWILQITSSSRFMLSTWDKIGPGYWLGLIFFVAGIAGWKLGQNATTGLNAGCLLVLSIESFIGGFVLVGLEAAAIDLLNWPQCSSSDCGTARGLMAGLLICGMASIIINALLVIATIKIVRPGSINPSE